MNFAEATEKELREGKTPRCDTLTDLVDFIRIMENRPHDYGTCCYAMSMCAEAAFNYIADKLGVTGFQASCADMDLIRRTRGLKFGFKIVDYSKLLYPQYVDEFNMSAEELLENPPTRKAVRAEAVERLKHVDLAHEDVIAHWQRLAALPQLPGEPTS